MLSLADLFIVGVTFDVLGGYYLARGLLARPRDIARRTATLTGGNPNAAASQIEAGADGRVGLFFLAVGFTMQAGGYLAEVAGVSLSHGAARSIAAVALAAVLAFSAVMLASDLRRRVIKHLPIDVARLHSATGELDPLPDHNLLVNLADILGFSIAGIETRSDPGWASAGGPAA